MSSKKTEDISSPMKKVTLGDQEKLSRAELFRMRSWFPAMMQTWMAGMVENR